jgi:hypothetical protein
MFSSQAEALQAAEDSHDFSVELFEHLLAARYDALFRELDHPGGLRVAPEQPEDLLMLRFGLTAKSLGPCSLHVGLEMGGLRQVEAVRPHVSRQDEHSGRRLRAEQAATGGLLDHERVRVVDAQAYLVGGGRDQVVSDFLGHGSP